MNRLTWHDYGAYATVTLPVTNDLVEKFAPRADDGLEGDGFDLTALAMVQIESFRPELKPLIGFSPQLDRFSAYSKHIDELQAFADEFDKALDDPFAFAFLLDNARPNADWSGYGIDALPSAGDVDAYDESVYTDPTYGDSAYGAPEGAAPAYSAPAGTAPAYPRPATDAPTGILSGLRCPRCGSFAMSETTTLADGPAARSYALILTIAVIIFIMAVAFQIFAQMSWMESGDWNAFAISGPLVTGIVFAAFIVSFVKALRKQGRTIRQCSACGYTEAVDPQQRER